MKRQRQTEAGFTLIELMVTVFILAIGLGVIFALVTMTADLGREKRDEAHIRRFVDMVFAAVEEDLLDRPNQDPFEVFTLTAEGVVRATIVMDGTEAFWPPVGEGINELEPKRIRYRVEQITTQEHLIEVRLMARMSGEPDEETFVRVFLDMKKRPLLNDYI